MCLMILKNALLFFFIVLIIHFMMQNRLIEMRNDKKRQLVVEDTMNKAKIATQETTSDIGSGVKEDTSVENMVTYAPVTETQKENGKGEVSKDHVIPKVTFNTNTDVVSDDKCKLSCDQFKEQKPPSLTEPVDKMKDLYDFVFSEEDSKNGKLDEFFPTNVTDKVIHETTEIHRHNRDVKLKQTKQENFRCNFEVIGSLCNSSNNCDSIEGIETLTTASSFFAEI